MKAFCCEESIKQKLLQIPPLSTRHILQPISKGFLSDLPIAYPYPFKWFYYLSRQQNNRKLGEGLGSKLLPPYW